MDVCHGFPSHEPDVSQISYTKNAIKREKIKENKKEKEKFPSFLLSYTPGYGRISRFVYAAQSSS